VREESLCKQVIYCQKGIRDAFQKVHMNHARAVIFILVAAPLLFASAQKWPDPAPPAAGSEDSLQECPAGNRLANSTGKWWPVWLPTNPALIADE
jgi:hypothetical protein